MDALHKFSTETRNVTVPIHAFDRAIRSLSKIEALALIRAAYKEEDGSYATLEHAKKIYVAITTKV